MVNINLALEEVIGALLSTCVYSQTMAVDDCEEEDDAQGAAYDSIATKLATLLTFINNGDSEKRMCVSMDSTCKDADVLKRILFCVRKVKWGEEDASNCPYTMCNIDGTLTPLQESKAFITATQNKCGNILDNYTFNMPDYDPYDLYNGWSRKFKKNIKRLFYSLDKDMRPFVAVIIPVVMSALWIPTRTFSCDVEVERVSTRRFLDSVKADCNNVCSYVPVIFGNKLYRAMVDAINELELGMDEYTSKVFIF